MFYCNACGSKHGWPTDTVVKSRGPCEICDAVAVCNDVPSRYLPRSTKTATPSPDAAE